MAFRKVVFAALALAMVVAPLAGQEASAQSFDMGGLAGGLIGGAIAGAMISNAQRQQPVVVYRQRPYGGTRRYASRRTYPRRQVARPASVPRSMPASVVDTSADPFAARSAAAVPVSAQQ